MRAALAMYARYFSYVLRHKWWVLVAGCKTGAPLWRLIVHDWSKFTPAELSQYANNFSREWPEGRPQHVKDAFDRAWLHHQRVNDHHWQYWVLIKDDGETKPLEMPEACVREMVADWMGAGRAITGRWEVLDWYCKNYREMNLHFLTRARVEELLRQVGKGGQ